MKLHLINRCDIALDFIRPTNSCVDFSLGVFECEYSDTSDLFVVV